MKHYLTPAELDYIREHFALNRTVDIANAIGCGYSTVTHAARRLGLKKDPEFISRYRYDGTEGLGYRFHSEQIPWNKGIKWQAGGRAKEHRFKPGNMPHNYRGGSGAIVQRKDGPYICIEVKRWKRLAVHVWEQAHGPLPHGYLVRQKDGDRNNCNLENLQLVTRAENMAKNSIQNMSPEVRQMKLTIGAFNRKIHEHERQRSAHHPTQNH